MRFLRRTVLPAFFLATTLISCGLQPSEAAETTKTAVRPPLTIPWIMRGPELYGTEPTDVRWSLDSRRIYFLWKEPGRPTRERPHWYRYDRDAPADKRLNQLTPAQEGEIPPPFTPLEGNWSGTTRVVYERDGDLYQMRADSPAPQRLTDTPSIRESDPHLMADGKRVIYRQGDNLFVLDSVGGQLVQWTDIRSGPTPREEMVSSEGAAKVAEQIERGLFDTVRARNEERERARAERKESEERQKRKPFYLGAS